MATTSEQRKQFADLRRAGKTLEEAKATAYGNVAPVSPPAISGVRPTWGATLPIAPTVAQPVATTPPPPTSTVPPDSTLGKAQAIRDANGGTLRNAVSQVEGNVGTQVTPAMPTSTTTPSGATLDASGNVTPTQNEKDINNQYGWFIQDNWINSVQPKSDRALSDSHFNLDLWPSKKPWIKTEAPIDYNTSVWREGEIQKNISEITAWNPTLLKDRNAFNQSFGYETADQGKKAILDSAFQSGQPRTVTSDEMFSTFLTKTPVADDQKSSLPYRIAQNRYAKASSYSTMTPSQVSSAMNNGKLIEWSQTYEDLKTLNPKIVQDAENLRKVNWQSTNIWTYSNNPDGTKVKTNNLETTFAEDYMENFWTSIKDMFKVYSTEEIQNIIRTPEVKEAEDKAFEYEKKIDDLDLLIEKADKDILESQKGTWATAVQVRLLQQSAREKLNEERNGLVKDYTRYANKANNLITQNTTNFQTQQTQQNARNSAMLWVQNTLLNAQLWRENAVFQSNLWLQTNQAEFDQKIAQQTQAMNDPYTAIPAMVEEYKKLWIPFSRSTQQIIQDFQWSGQDLATYLSGLQKQIQSKPEYKRYQELQQGQLTDTEKLLLQSKLSEKSDIRNFEQQKELAKLNKDATREQFLFELENDPAKKSALIDLEAKLNANKSLFDVLGKNVGTYEGNRGYDLAGKLGDPMPAGGNWKVESIIDANYTSSPYGNSVVMVDENGNKVRYSHLQSIGVKPWDQLGFGDIVGTRGNTGNVKGASGETLTPDQLKAGRWAHLDVEIKDSKWNLLSQAQQVEWLKSKKAGKQTYDANALAIANGVWDLADLTATDKKAILPQIEAIVNSRMTDDAGRNAIIKSALYKKDISDSTLQKLTDMESVKWQLTSIESRLSKQSVWPILGALKKYNPYDTEAQVAMAELAGLTPKVARGIFGEVGVLTDTDIANYQKTLPNLTSTEEKNKFVIDFMRNLLARWVMKTIETQAKGQRNMSAFIEDYDNAKQFLWNTSQVSSIPQNVYSSFESDYNDL